MYLIKRIYISKLEGRMNTDNIKKAKLSLVTKKFNLHPQNKNKK